MGAYNNIQRKFFRAIGREVVESVNQPEVQFSGETQGEPSKKQPSKLRIFLLTLAAGVGGTWGYTQLSNPDGLGCDLDVNVGVELVKDRVQELEDQGVEITLQDLDQINHETRVKTMQYGSAYNCPQSTKRFAEQGRIEEMNRQYKDLGR